ncbi:MAG: glycosyltransferase [Verrucomicrobia bacterium]|jgi:glycosyltransferase involved in cell wall biosynthesis|nr:glycosyltransferase [Verrucomicrobiota bacterium]
MKILYFHQHFNTPKGYGGIRSYEMAKALIASGHEVTMVCGASVKSRINFPGEFRKGMKAGEMDGIPVVLLDLPYSNYDSFIKRSLAFLRYAWRCVWITLRSDADLIFATSTPLTAGVPGIVSKLLRRKKKFVFEVRDLWPELPREMGVIRNPAVLWSMGALEYLSYHFADACIGLSPGIVEGIKRRKPRKEVMMIPNSSDVDLFRPENRELPTRYDDLIGEKFVAMFTGAHGIANGLDAVLDAAIELQTMGRNDIEIFLIGDGREKPRLQARANKEGIANLRFLDPIPKLELCNFLPKVNAGLMILDNVPAFYNGTSPNKFFDYISSGIPVVNNYPGWLASMIVENQLGIAVEPGNPSAMAEALCYLADHPEESRAMGIRARQFAETEFSREKLAQKFCNLLEQIGSLDTKN